MNLQLLCKINGVVIGINGLSAILMYNMWFLIVGFHIMTGRAGGATAYVNVVLIAILGILFFMQSRKSE